jgi:hypothetical protein
MPKTMTRRAVLAGTPAAIAAAATLPTIASAAVDDPAVALWRTYRAVQADLYALLRQQDETRHAIPDDLRDPRVHVADYVSEFGADKGKRTPMYVYSEDELEKHAHPGLGRSKEWVAAKKAELQESHRRWWAHREASGLEALLERSEEMAEFECAAINAIEALRSTSPAAIAAKLNVAFDFAGGDGSLDDYPWSTLAAVLRDQLPALPADMAAALAPLTRREGLIRDALRAGGTPAMGIDSDEEA